MNKEPQKDKREVGPMDFDGAAIINPDGSETPITDEMIKKACDDIEPSAQAEDKTQH